MKKVYTIFAALFLTATLWAQSPEKMSYQAVIRNSSDALVTNTQIGMQISILQGSASGTAVYVETQTPTTNANGLVSIEIGTGTTSDDFSSIDWANGTYFIKTETDPAGGTTYSITGTSQLISVAYALHAKTAETVTGGITETDPLFTAWDKSTGISITESQISDLTHTVDTDTHIDSAGVAALGFVAGAHTVDTDTQLDSTDIANLGYVAGAEYDPTYTAWDKSTGISITESQISDLTHTVDTDTHIDSTGVAALGFVAGAHTVDTDTQLDSTDIANLGYVAGAETDPSVPNGTQTGEMQYWNGTAWVTVAPGNEGASLQMIGGIPTWTNPPPPNVTNPTTGEIWMDRNLGASQVATSNTDAASYGDLYQWGRGTDGHQIRTSSTTSTLATSDNPGHGDFITNGSISPGSSSNYDWRNPQNDNLWQGVSGTNNPCPSGYRLPTEAEWNAERLSWSSNNSAGAFASPLKLPVAGYREGSDGSFSYVGSRGSYWSSTVSGTDARYLYFSSSNAFMNSNFRAIGLSVRCIKD